MSLKDSDTNSGSQTVTHVTIHNTEDEENKDDVVTTVEDRNRIAAVLTIKIRKINDILDKEEIAAVRKKYKAWMQAYEDFLLTQEAYQKSMVSIEEDEDGEIHKKIFLDFKGKMEQWFLQKEAIKEKKKDIIEDDRSVKTNATKRSRRSECSISSSLAKTRLKKAGLNAKAELLKKKQALEQSKFQLKMQEEQYEIEEELAIANAEEEVLKHLEIEDNIDDNNDNNTHTLQGNKDENTYLPQGNNDYNTYLSPYNKHRAEIPERSRTRREEIDRYTDVQSSSSNSQKSTEEVLMKMVQELKRPPSEIKKFDGSGTDFKRFMRQFQTKVIANTDNADDRMNYLEQYTTGEANTIVIGYSHLDAVKGYPAAVKELNRRYGDPIVNAHKYIKKAVEWPEIKSNDAKAEVLYAVEDIKGLEISGYSHNLQKIVSNLPYDIQKKWQAKFQQLIEQNTLATLEHLVELVRKEAIKLNDPVFGRDALAALKQSPHTDTKKKDTRSRYKASYATVSDDKEKHSETTTSDLKEKKIEITTSKSCLFCKKEGHMISTCYKFKPMTTEEKIDFLKHNGMCFGCLKHGHMKMNCTQKAICTKCNRSHPDILHMEKEFKNPREVTTKKEITSQVSLPEDPTSLMGAGADGQCTLAVVPVNIKMKNSNTIISTYAFQDPGSTVCFCTENLMRQIGVTGRRRRITVSTMGVPHTMDTYMIEGLEISGLTIQEYIQLPTVYTKDSIPVEHRHIPQQADIDSYPHLNSIHLPKLETEIGLLIGNCVPDAYTPLESAIGPPGTPYATRTRLGWTIWGLIRPEDSLKLCSNFIDRRKDIEAVDYIDNLKKLEKDFQRYVGLDFPEKTIDETKELSIEDRNFKDFVQSTLSYQEGQYSIDLPFRNPVHLLSNEEMVKKRLHSTKKKLVSNQQFYEDYCKFMNDIISEGYAEIVSEEKIHKSDGRVWYIPHHGIYHPRKRDKLRVVFDCSAKFEGISLNDLLLQGPNVTNNLIGVLLRYRQENIAIMADIKSIFYRVKVPEKDRDYLRFYWWTDGVMTKEPSVYRMTVHLFGAVSSPACANIALHQTAKDNEEDYNPEVIETIYKNFYVDDCLKSVDTTEKAVRMINDLTELCSKGGFKLTKWMSNDRQVIQTVPSTEKAKVLADLDLDYENIPTEHTLGVLWSPEEDVFGFKINLEEKPATRRGILSTVCSVFDPLGLASPYVLTAKILLQELCSRGLQWDEKIHEEDLKTWNNWLEHLSELEYLTVPRCFKPNNFGKIKEQQIHHFSDASNTGYGVVSYIRIINEEGKIYCNLVMSKSRVAPLQRKTIPKMELNAATIAVKLHHKITQELDVTWDNIYFWTDSQTVLRYIANQRSRFNTFVANRLTVIHEGSTVSQWNYIRTQMNPSDKCSRGLIADRSHFKQWVQGPEFLYTPESGWEKIDIDTSLSTQDPEVKLVVNVITDPESRIEYLIQKISSWKKLKRIMGYIFLFISKLKKTDTSKTEVKDHAEQLLIQHEQRKHFPDEFNSLEKNENVKKSSKLIKLDPYLQNGVIVVGGRLERADIPQSTKHPTVLPRESPITALILDDIHRKLGHLGKNSMLATLREKYWVLQAVTAIKQLVNKCVTCRKYQAKTGYQKMADLPVKRFAVNEPPFSHTGIDYFGPIDIKRGRTIVKRYGVVFTCFAIRAIHLEVAHSLDTDSCVNAVRKFLCRRGNVKSILTDNGTNFVAASKELTDIDWTFNPPSGSHFGGIWERQIRTIRKIMFSLLKEQVINLNDENLQTLFCEIEDIVNSRPISRNSDDPNDLEAITPNHLLHLNNKDNVPIGIFTKEDNYARKRWRQVQYLSNLFWTRWIREYLPSLQERQRWMQPE